MKKAVILLNMGGPSSLLEVDMFLKNMFNDPRILPIKSPFFRSLVASFVANRRSETAKANYRKIGGKSPLIGHTFNLIQKLQSLDPSRFYTYAMRYTPPMTDMAVRELAQKEIEEVTLFSLYPQYSTTTTLSSIEEFHKQCALLSYFPKIKEIDRYFEDSNYNEAIIDRILEALKGDNPEEFTLIFSAHGLPQSVIDAGDPYEKEVHANIQALTKLLEERGITFKKITHAYQSKVGPMKWLEPSLDEVLKLHAKEKILLYPIAFTLDNSETDFELRIEYQEKATHLGITDYRVASCLNDSTRFAHAIIKLISQGEIS
ncbi:ferrochelatase [Wolinella succinogenes]|uniref:ferrochelatase n=1 Tax=Wolinella succinogenes TaxID=844 RepID=UPI0024099229|nr:ferrochelatase [Wolinella succinogenes]